MSKRKPQSQPTSQHVEFRRRVEAAGYIPIMRAEDEWQIVGGQHPMSIWPQPDGRYRFLCAGSSICGTINDVMRAVARRRPTSPWGVTISVELGEPHRGVIRRFWRWIW